MRDEPVLNSSVEFVEPANLDAPVSLTEIVAYLTSCRVMDYTAMSDFFLTFRVYTNAFEVLELLLARLYAAFSLMSSSMDESGRDISLRTFVVLRHWINNFFADDFLPDYSLRLRLVNGLEHLGDKFSQTHPHCGNICQQLAKVWAKRLSMYWDVQSVDLWPMHAGGEFGATTLDAPGRRRTLLSFYEPLGPMASHSSNEEPRQLGSLIRGGILVNTNPAVLCIRESPKKHRVRFFHRSKHTEPSMLKLDGPKVDLLALKVLQEMKALIAVRERLTDAEVEGSRTPTKQPPPAPISSSTPPPSQHQMSVDTLNIRQVLDDSASICEDSMIDLRRSGIATGGRLLDDISFERASYASFSSLSTLSLAPSVGTDRDTEGQGPSRDTSRAYGVSPSSISLLSEMSTGYEMAPCAGFNNRVAAELAAIPDESQTEDAMLIAIQKLEGTYKPKVDPNTNKIWLNAIRSVPSFVSGDSKLYSEAFASVRGVSGLAIPESSSTPPPPPHIEGLGLGILGMSSPRRGSGSSSETIRHRGQTQAVEHVPFILSLSADTLAEQMTLLEKDALDQVDWKELAEIKWTQSSFALDSWLEFLATNNPRGVDVVTSRFNLVSNWIKSEVVLCQQASLQARAITRFIHIAQECLRLQNFATLFQIVLALTSDFLRTRSSTAWSLVDKRDLGTLKELEQLVSPLRNFRNLRDAHRAMKFSTGCIPFTGLYLADLLYNNEKPSWIESKVNFAKFRTTSALTRSLLECIEWSRNYRILPKPEILSKCLYLQSLTREQLELV